ncbi:MAG: SGNH/GDSL hydrolase family protein [Armatimonadota bacterium]|nr:SGNH/GDSL hydrolase family protein [Armatimonadota bacterium]
MFQQNTRILFQGDSITDGGRGRSEDPNHILGQDYAYLIAARFGAEMPERNLTFLNRGVSGNKISDLQARWKSDTLDLKPDILSILIGVNDVGGSVPIDQYEQGYDQLLKDTVAALPNVRLVLCEPFTLPVGNVKEHWEEWHAKIVAEQTAVARLATKYHCPVAHFQKALDDGCLRAPADHWIWDGVHPTYSGHQLLADEWTRTVDQFYGSKLASSK